MKKNSLKNQTSPNLPVPQYSLLMILFMFTWPGLWFCFLIYIVGPHFFNADGTVPTWLFHLIWLLGNGAELVVALVILRREGCKLTWNGLRDRINLRWPNSWNKWLIILGVIVVCYFVGDWLSFTPQWVASFMPVPTWIPFNNPSQAINSLKDGYPDVNFIGNWWFVFYRWVILGFICNMVGEELYYRGMLMPKMKGVFGRWYWVANGFLFTLKHFYFYWNIVSIFPYDFGFAFIAGPIGSLPIAILSHWLSNMEPFTLFWGIKAALGL
jgi:hypothetical protein